MRRSSTSLLRGRQRASRLAEPLEPRRLLAGLTIVTHGLQSNGVLPQWVDRMAEAVDRRIEPQSANLWTDVALYRMRMTQTDGVVSVQSFARASGPPPSASRSGEAVLVLDWASISGIGGPSVTPVAQAAVNELLVAGSSLGFGVRAVALPVHVIGHSRGAALCAEIARFLGQNGVWVDQLTTLDPYPFGGDPGPSMSANVYDNVVFADNYYETSDFFVHGGPVAGAHNVGPLDLPGGSSLAHTDVHTYYHGTIGRAATGDGDVTLTHAWYNNSALVRATSGFDASRVSGAARPAAGVSSLAGGNAARIHVVPTASTWPNVGSVTLSGGSGNGAFANGQSVTLDVRYQAQTNSSEIDFYLDDDANLFNGFSRTLAVMANVPPTGAPPATQSRTTSFTWNSFGLAGGAYYVHALITDGTPGHVRVAQLPQTLFVTSTGMATFDERWSDDTANHDWSDPRNWSPGGAPGAASRATIDFGTVNLANSVAVDSIGLSGGAVATASATQRLERLWTAGTSRFRLSAGGNRVLVARSLSIAGTSAVDLYDNDLILDYTGASPMAGVQSSINLARAGGAWTGPGLTSTAARDANPANTTLGAMEAADFKSIHGVNATFAGEPIDDTAVLVKYTWYGDADFNGEVNFDDYVRTDSGFNTGGNAWITGDFDGNGAVDFDDYVLLDLAFNTQAGTL